MAEMRGKGWRVLGYLIWMLGAGVILDSDAVRLGAVMSTIGALMFLAGAWQSWSQRVAGEQGSEQPHSAHRV